jgi:hypothetical protein
MLCTVSHAVGEHGTPSIRNQSAAVASFRSECVWRAGCFLAYADTNASTAREEAWRGWFYDDRADRGWFYDDTPTAACMATSTAAERARCLNESARVVPALKEGRQLSLVHGHAVVVVGYSCYLRVPLFPAATRWLTYGELTRSLLIPFFPSLSCP